MILKGYRPGDMAKRAELRRIATGRALGLWGRMSEDQRSKALAYDGDENIGSMGLSTRGDGLE